LHLVKLALEYHRADRAQIGAVPILFL
jgi:hypothetical protein